MLSIDYVKEHIDEIEHDDFCDRRFTKRFVSFLPTDEWEKFGFSYTGDDKFIPKEWTKENVINQLKDDLDFAIEKATNQRGISACLMYNVLRSWCKVLENGLEDTEYGWYGDKLIKAIDEYYGFGLYVEDEFIESRIQHLKDSIFTMLHDDGYELQIDNDTFIVELDNIGKAKIQITKGE